MRHVFVLLRAAILFAIPVWVPWQTALGQRAPVPTDPLASPSLLPPVPAPGQAQRPYDRGDASRYATFRIPVHAAQSPEAAQAMREFSDLETKSIELARQIRSIDSEPGDEDQTQQRDELRQQLAKTIQAAFEARQKVQQIEVDQLKKRLSAVEETLQKRESKKGQIIDSRLDELLDENRELQWDPSSGAGYGHPNAVLRQTWSALAPTAKAYSPAATLAPAAPPAPGLPPTAPLAQNTPPSVSPRATNPSRQTNVTAANETFLRQHSLLMPELAQTREDLINVAAALEKAQREVEQLAKTSPDENGAPGRELREAQERLALSERHMERVRMEYETQLRLLKLQVDSAQMRVMDAKRDYQRVKQLGNNVVSQQEIDRLESELALASNELEKVTILLELHRSADKTERSKSAY